MFSCFIRSRSAQGIFCSVPNKSFDEIKICRGSGAVDRFFNLNSALLSASFSMNRKLKNPHLDNIICLNSSTQRGFTVTCFDTGDLFAYEELIPHAVHILRKQSVLVCVRKLPVCLLSFHYSAAMCVRALVCLKS